MSKMQFDAVTFLATVKVWKSMHDFTLADIVELTGVARSTLGFILSGDRVPTIAEFVNICHMMDFDPREFFKKEGK